MSIFSEEQVLKVLNSYNPWWKLGTLPDNYKKQMKRVAYYESFKTLINEDIRRFVVLSGARRVGKTTILYQLIEELFKQGIPERNILYLSLDNPILKFGTLDKIMDIYINSFSPEGNVYIFLDEIQYSQDWDNWLKVFYDQNEKWRIVATGSASPLIERGVAESGVGRWSTITVPTLSFYEYCQLIEGKGSSRMEDKMKRQVERMPIEEKMRIVMAKDSKEIQKILQELVEKIASQPLEIELMDEKIQKNFSINKLQEFNDQQLKEIVDLLEPIKKYFNRYLIIGGFPELVLAKDDKVAQKLLREDIVDKVLKRDMPELFGIRNISVLEKVFLYLCFESSNIINYSSMGQDLEGVSVPTIQDYIKYLEKANLIYISEPLNMNGSKLLSRNPKIYVVDSAIRNAVLMKEDVLTDPTEMGYIVETAVYRHMYTYIKNTTGSIGYYRGDKQDREIDVVTNSVKGNMYIEVKYRENPKIKKENPIYKMDKENDSLFIITKNTEDYGVSTLQNGKKIVKIPAYVYLYLIGLEEMRNLEK